MFKLSSEFLACVGFLASVPHADAHDMYSHLTTTTGSPCCDGHDCRPTHHRVGALGVEMLVGSEWLAIRPQEIQYRTLDGDTGETNGGHWCGQTFPLLGVVTYCAILPPNAASLGYVAGHNRWGRVSIR
jgi:hypothetical protein